MTLFGQESASCAQMHRHRHLAGSAPSSFSVGGLSTLPQLSAQQGVKKVDMGDYEPVVPWPKPLPDTDLSHDGWTWGSGAGVWAESPDKVWVMQRGEISLPPGAEPWICACLLNPRRTNTGRRDYSGTPYPYQMRRHHLVFAVDGNGKTIEEWLQHDKYLAPPRGTGLGEMGRGPHKILMNPYDPEKHIWIVDDDMHEINIFTNDGKLVKTMGERGVPGRGPNNFNRPDRHRVAARRHVLRRRRLRRHARREVRSQRQVPDGLGTARRSIPTIPSRTNSGRCTASASAATAGCSSPIASITGCRCSTRTASS